MDAPRPVSVPVHTWMVAYDVTDTGRRSRVAKILKGAGVRVQFSVFECRLNRTELMALRDKVYKVLDRREDSVRWYPLCGFCASKTVQDGVGPAERDEGFYLV